MSELGKNKKKYNHNKIFRIVLWMAFFLLFFPIIQSIAMDWDIFSVFVAIPVILLSGCIIFPLTIMRMKEGDVNRRFKILGYAAIFFYFFLPTALLTSAGRTDMLLYWRTNLFLYLFVAPVLALTLPLFFGGRMTLEVFFSGGLLRGFWNFLSNLNWDNWHAITLNLSHISAFVGVFCFIVFKIYALIVGYEDFEDPHERNLAFGFKFPIYYYLQYDSGTHMKNTQE